MFIAEVKLKSPYGYRSPHTFDRLLRKARKVGDAVAIHTDPRWGGSLHLVEEAAMRCRQPILAKGIHFSDHEVGAAFKAGATWVLTVGREISHPQTWYEPSLSAWANSFYSTIRHNGVRVCNSRDLQTGEFHPEIWGIARQVYNGPLIQASGIRGPEDVKPDAYGFIVGEHLMDWPE